MTFTTNIFLFGVVIAAATLGYVTGVGIGREKFFRAGYLEGIKSAHFTLKRQHNAENSR